MSTKRIKLYFCKFENPDLVEVDIGVIRLFCEVAFVTEEGYTDSYSAVLDTGAPVSVIPYQIWSMLKVKKIKDYAIRGIVPKKECSLPVTIGEVSCILLDKEERTRRMKVKAYLAHSNEVPLIIGFKDLLDRFGIYLDFKKNFAYLEC
jgi:predicted aspartyl protease